MATIWIDRILIIRDFCIEKWKKKTRSFLDSINMQRKKHSKKNYVYMHNFIPGLSSLKHIVAVFMINIKI